MRIRDIAEQLGVSSATVSMALNHRPGVSLQTRQRIIEYANSVQYGRNRAARTAKPKGVLSFLVYKRHGRIVTGSQFFAQLIEAVEYAARARNYRLDLSYCDTDETQEVLGNLQTAKIDGLLLLASEMEEEDFEPFKSLPFPVTVVDCDLLDCNADKVLINNYEGIWKAIRYLHSRGHRQIGYLHSAVSIRNFEQRAHSYRQSITRLNLSAPEKWTISLGPTADEAFSEMHDRLEKGLKLPPALVADNDVIAVGGMRAMKKFGLRVPTDISIVGFDDVPVCTFSEPALTSMRVPVQALGSSAVQQLIARIQGHDAPRMLTAFSVELIERDTVRDYFLHSLPPDSEEGPV